MEALNTTQRQKFKTWLLKYRAIYMSYIWEWLRESLTIVEYLFVYIDFEFRRQNHFFKRIK
jgi:hypothetical protein